MTWQEIFNNFLTPAIVISVAAYFVRLFGKAIADQVPYADNRSWQIELSGLMFLVDFLFSPVAIAIAVLLSFEDAVMGQLSSFYVWLNPITYHWGNLAIVFLLWMYYALASQVLSERKYQYSSLAPRTAWGGPGVSEDQRKKVFNRVANTNAVVLQPSVVLLALVYGIEILSGDVLWIAVFSVQMFAALVVLAFNYSLMRAQFPRMDIHLTDSKRIVKNALLLKMTEDGIRVRDNDRILLLNKGAYSRLEIRDAEQKVNTHRAIVPFAIWLPWFLSLYLLWEHKLFLAIVVGLVIPLIAAVVGALLLALPQKSKEIIAANGHLSFWEHAEKYFDSFPRSVKIAGLLASTGIIGALAAWWHHIPLMIVFGIVIPLIAWAILQVKIMELPKPRPSGDVNQ